METIQVDGGVLMMINGKRTLVDFTTYDRIQKIKKIVSLNSKQGGGR